MQEGEVLIHPSSMASFATDATYIAFKLHGKVIHLQVKATHFPWPDLGIAFINGSYYVFDPNDELLYKARVMFRS